MIVVMDHEASPAAVEAVLQRIRDAQRIPRLTATREQTIIIAEGDGPAPASLRRALEAARGVARIVSISAPYTLVSRAFNPADTVVRVGAVRIGDEAVAVIAGPCSVETRDQVVRIAAAVKAGGATMLRAGAFKPRTSPYSFQGLGHEGLRYLAEARDATGLPVVSEALDAEQLHLVLEYADMVQIGARNMQNFSLLRSAGRAKRPVLLKRGPAATLEEFLSAAEYLMYEGNTDVVLCERGVRGFDDQTRYAFDVCSIAALKQLTHLPVIADPSHATGRRGLVAQVAKAAIAAGADGIMVEVHEAPDRALSDGPQQLDLDGFTRCVRDLSRVAQAVGRTLAA